MLAVLFTRNLMTTSSAAPAAAAAGYTLKTLRTPAQLTAEWLADAELKAVLIDLGEAELAPAEIIGRLRALSLSPGVIAFGPHVDTARLAAAEAAGCHYVISRGQLQGALPELLAACAAIDRA